MRSRLVAGALVAALVASGAASATAPAAAVVGGQEADPGEWPWQVALLLGGSITCGGSLVAADVVLTAAHCTEGVRPSDFVVLAGTVDLRAGGQRRRVEAIDQHEDYDPAGLTSDLALLELDRAFRLDDDIAVIPLASPAESAVVSEAGKPATVTGWGVHSEEDDTSDVLLEGELDTYADDVCARFYREAGEAVVGDIQVCAGRERGHVDACQGDSGGPLVAPLAEGEWRQIGIVSWGIGCGELDRPTVYTEVAAFSGWLAERGVEPVGVEQVEGDGARIPARGTVGKASRYPLALEVDGLEGPVSSISVELIGLSHPRPSDLDIWLVAPDGTTVALMSDIGGTAAIEDVDVVVVDGIEPRDGATLAGARAPSDLEQDPQRRGPDPATALAALTGIDPVGTWQLLVADDREGAAGSLDGWRLELR